jgi:putative ABC transport system ATP-binding protein
MQNSAGNNELFHIENISYESGGKTILADVNLAIMPGQITLITGASGSGKSTLLKIMGMLISPSSGRVYYHNHLLDDFRPCDFRSRAVLVGQKPFVVEGTVRDNLKLPFALKANRGKTYSDKLFSDNLSSLGLHNDFMEKNSAKLSGGESQRMAIARAVSLGPEALLLDEPSSALDIASEEKIINFLVDLKTRISIVIVAHSPSYLQVSDRIMILKQGRLVKDTDKLTTAELKKHLEDEA